MPIVTPFKRTTAEFAEFVTTMAQLNPNGFRNPGKHGTSLPEKACISSGMMTPQRVGSERGNNKRRIRKETRRLIREGKTWV